MGAGTSPADPASAGPAAEGPDAAAAAAAAEGGSTEPARGEVGSGSTAPGTAEPGTGSTASGTEEPGSASAEPDSASAEPGNAEPDGKASAPRRTRRFPLFTRDTARPEGGGRAASGDAPAPARQWPLLTVLGTAGAGLLIVALDPFAEAFRIGTILIGAALIAGAVLRWVVPAVGMLAVRSRFTDLVTYGLMGTLIVLLALVAQPNPWLDVPILENAVRFTIR
ncbi:DUF3017 domain-containing protein [Streptomyces cyaneofuscatus]|uniref:DUF3017 domain-containing protein n=1 Tax=Streptomyces cyaneofuscatus TaxID=66883 RepID=A0ABZ1F0R1_9ACTN|nr:DUF3017 domain-containing protein [Streptomyces cyaneofuscatus]WSB09855.1 DUF3017 domain-containing protein [Streptomyces cyaneofuscatus]WSD46613.1 DUF3017 domain-containing protein [Streptomyces cyaneofuscatus]